MHVFDFSILASPHVRRPFDEPNYIVRQRNRLNPVPSLALHPHKPSHCRFPIRNHPPDGKKIVSDLIGHDVRYAKIGIDALLSPVDEGEVTGADTVEIRLPLLPGFILLVTLRRKRRTKRKLTVPTRS